jgi:ferrous iron transport protein A
MTVLDLKIGETASIVGFTDEFLGVRLMEMGFLPGLPLSIEMIAPLGDPVVISGIDCSVGLRLSEAGHILVIKK